MKRWSDYSPQEARDELRRVREVQTEWANRFVAAAKAQVGLQLDYTVESLADAWQFVLDSDGIDVEEPWDPWMLAVPPAMITERSDLVVPG